MEDKRKYLFSNCVFAVKMIFKYAPFLSALYTVTTLTAGLLYPLNIYFLQRLVDNVTVFITDGGDMKHIILLGVCYVLSLFSVQIYWLIQPKMGRFMNRRLRNSLTPDVIKKYNSIEYYHFEESKFNDLTNFVSNRPQQYIVYTMYLQIVLMIQGVIQLIGILGLFFSASFWIGLGASLIGIPIAILNSHSSEKKARMSRDTTTDQRKGEYLQGLFSDKHAAYEIKIFGAKNYLLDLWYENRRNVQTWYNKTTKSNLRLSTIGCLLMVSFTSFAAITLVLGFISGKIGLGVLVSVMSALGGMFFGIIYSITECYSYMIKVSHDTKYFKELLSYKNRPENETVGISKTADIVFDNVSFAYPNTKREILHNVSFTIGSGEKAAIVGVNGAGKSTMIKLLCGLYKPDSGHIYIGGKDINELSQDDVRQAVSVVFQDFGCYQMTLRENIAFGDLPALNDDERLSEALRRAGADEVLAKGLDVNLGQLYENGIDISRGQWQRIAVARAFLSKSNFVILDEPTASLDPIAESRMYSAFLDILNERGTIIISHRLASAKMADKIIVLEGGEVVAMGNHTELMREGGLYSVMFEEQSSWYRDDEVII